MMSEQNRAVEQLWYTWSDVGLDTIRAGFRIRAASEGLQDIRSVRVQSLDRYQRYSLPQDVNPAIPPEVAPLCLALINTGHERILVQRMYVGKDAVGRYGSFFVHLLAGLEGFSARDAILLWRSAFWQYSDVSLKGDRYCTSLERVPRAYLEQSATMRGTLPRTKQDSTKIRKYLPYIIQAYLTKKPVQEQATTQVVPQKLYIAAAADDIAQLIFGLTSCLPEPLLQNLTFSTYEPDVAEATTEIVGTCWLSVPDAERDPHVAQLLPESYYQERLALNCYTGRSSPLENNSLAAEFAQEATEYVVQGGEEFKELLDALKGCADVDALLSLYQSLSVQEPSEQNIVFALSPRSQSNYVNSARMLSRTGYQRGIIFLITHKAGWWQNFCRAALINLGKHSNTIPMLAQALSRIGHQAMLNAVIAAREEMSRRRDMAIATTSREIETFGLMIDLMQCTAPPEVDAEIWIALLRGLAGIKHIAAFFNGLRKLYVLLIGIWCRLLPFSKEHYELLHPFLSLTWDTFGAFLALHLPLDWTEETTKVRLLHSSSALSKEDAYALHQGYHGLIEDFLQRLTNDPQYWHTVKLLFKRLINGHYPGKMPLLFILLSSMMAKYPEDLKQLLEMAHLTADEQAQFLMAYGPQHLSMFTGKTSIILDTFKDLRRSDTDKKMLVLFSWLDSAHLSSWFGTPPAGENNLAMILDKASLTPPESAAFLQRYGQRYIPLYPQSPTFLNLFRRYADSVGEDRRTLLSILSIWIQVPLDQGTLELLLQSARLLATEQVNFLRLYGTYFASFYAKSPILSQYLQAFYTYLLTADIENFRSNSLYEAPSDVEKLLEVLCNTSAFPSAYCWCFWHTIVRFMREPTTLQEEPQKVAESVSWLLGEYTAQRKTQSHIKLIQQLASACLEEENELPELIEMLEGMLALPDLLLLLYEIAVHIGDNFHQKHYENTLLALCIDYAVTYKALLRKKDEQQVFMQNFLDELLRDASTKTFKWLNADAKWWPSEMATTWQQYKVHAQRAPSVPTPSPFEQLELWKERTVAFTKMRMAVRSGNQKRFARASIEYMTTLNGNAQRVPPTWWPAINEAVRDLNTFEKALWERYEAQQHPPLVRAVTQERLSSAQAPANKPSILRRLGQRWIWMGAFLRMRQALRSKNIGKIVQGAKDYMPMLVISNKQVSETWWRLLAAAFDFFIACEDVIESADESRERAIIAAYQKIDELINAREPAPWFTEHERRRIESAMCFIASLEAQRLRDVHRQWILATATQQLLGPPGASRRQKK